MHHDPPGRPGYDLRCRYREEDLQEVLGMIDRKTAYILQQSHDAGDAKRFQRLIERS